MPLTVQEILDDKGSDGTPTHAVSPDTPVRDAVATMARRHIGSVVVLRDSELIGILTLREVLMGLERLGAALLDTATGEVMNEKPAVVRHDDSADSLRALMTERHVSHAAVLKDGKLAGVISFHDIARSAVKDVTFENRLLKQYIKNWPQA